MALWQVKKEVALGTGHTCQIESRQSRARPMALWQVKNEVALSTGTPVKLRAVSLGASDGIVAGEERSRTGHWSHLSN